MDDWRIYKGDGAASPERIANRPTAPKWRQFDALASNRASTFKPPKGVVEAVNAALYLRRPVLVTGDPGTGKSSLAYAVAHELALGDILTWNINSRSTLLQGLYDYDALARLRDANLQRLREANIPRAGDANAPRGRRRDQPRPAPIENIGRFITLGAIGTAFLAEEGKPRVVLIDEIDKSDVDLPNDLLHVFENGLFEIAELTRIKDDAPQVTVRTLDGTSATIVDGIVRCTEFPIVIITSNGERDLPPAFLRRCLRIDLPRPDETMLKEIVKKHMPGIEEAVMTDLLEKFDARRDQGRVLATDQLLNAFYLVTQGRAMTPQDRAAIEDIVLRELDAR
jgi:MoxR-like ATPase